MGSGSTRGLAFVAPLLMVSIFSSAPALAQGVDEFGRYGTKDWHAQESPQDAALEVRFGRYLPNVDSEFGGAATPFRDVFGKKNRYLLGFELDWQALRIPYVGTVGPGVGLGFTNMSGPGFTSTGARSQQEVKLSVLPAYVVGVLRVDVLARETPVPLVPYVKGGLGGAMWWASDGLHTSRDATGRVGRALSWGYQYALGGMFLLDCLDDDAALQLDNTLGVNNSYLFVEWYKSDLDGFNSGKQMQVGTKTWFFGLAFEI